MKSNLIYQLINFLQVELAISADSIALAREHTEQDIQFLPMVLWKYGLLSLEQLEQVLDWLDAVPSQLDEGLPGKFMYIKGNTKIGG